MASKKLVRAVNVAGTWYGPGTDNETVPADVARRITNPKAWTDEAELAAAGAASSDDKAGTGSGRRLAATVTIGGVPYGPDDHVPADVARRITNPKAWEGGRLPTEAKEAEKKAAEQKEADGPQSRADAGSGTAGGAGAGESGTSPGNTAGAAASTAGTDDTSATSAPGKAARATNGRNAR